MDLLSGHCFGSGIGSVRVLSSGVRVSNYPTRPSPNVNIYVCESRRGEAVNYVVCVNDVHIGEGSFMYGRC